ncbi:MAG: SEL1-like repeat protein [Gammaproteobacteria bacterium]
MPHLQEEFKKTLYTAQTSDDPLIHYELGRMYEEGLGTKKDEKQAEVGIKKHSSGFIS